MLMICALWSCPWCPCDSWLRVWWRWWSWELRLMEYHVLCRHVSLFVFQNSLQNAKFPWKRVKAIERGQHTWFLSKSKSTAQVRTLPGSQWIHNIKSCLSMAWIDTYMLMWWSSGQVRCKWASALEQWLENRSDNFHLHVAWGNLRVNTSTSTPWWPKEASWRAWLCESLSVGEYPKPIDESDIARPVTVAEQIVAKMTV